MGPGPAPHVGRPAHRPAPRGPRPIWLDPSHGPLLTDLLAGGLISPVWCTSRRGDATTITGPLLGLPDFPYLDLPRPQITTSHPNGYLWKRDHVDPWLGRAPVAWIDDDFTARDHTWAAERTARGQPTLLVQPDPYTGLQPNRPDEIRKWARHQGAADSVHSTKAAQPAPPQVGRPFTGRTTR
ncbi:hypothetical protein [Streptomyces sp. NPDC058092]|uniref:hypothetical protein n=1 Tax=Streptomyces sp. NPDC058092 TaxID=3346336 RepID=UPI0036EA9C9F